MHFRPLKKTETRLLREAARFELAMPKFYRNASATWTTGEDEIVKHYQNCANLYGIFERDEKRVDKLSGIAYFELIADGVYNVHCDLKRGCQLAEVIPVIAQIRDYQFLGNMRICYAFVLRKNRPVKKMMAAIGFKPTMLKLYRGFSHNKMLEWVQLAIAKGSFSKWEIVN